MKCPGCGAEVEEGADLCLECGEPMGDSPVARAVRAESFPPSAAKPVAPPPAASARKRFVDDEPEKVRCPGCGIPTTRDRCPGCGSVIKRGDD